MKRAVNQIAIGVNKGTANFKGISKDGLVEKYLARGGKIQHFSARDKPFPFMAVIPQSEYQFGVYPTSWRAK